MKIPDRVVSRSELQRATGERGTRKWIAVKRVVFDVTECPKWRLNLHEGLHFPGQDLSEEIADAPHSESVFRHDCIEIVGRLEDITTSDTRDQKSEAS